MLALSPVAAVPDGNSPPVGNRRPGKAIRDSGTPFLAMLSALSPGKADRVSETKGQSIPVREQSMVRAKLETLTDQVSRLKTGGNAVGPALNVPIADKAKPKGENVDLRALPEGKTGKTKPAAHDVNDAVRQGSMITASSLDAQAALKAASNRSHAASTGSKTSGSNASSGIEITGTSEVAGKDGARVSIVDLRLKARGDGSARRDGARAGDDAAADPSRTERATVGARAETDPSLSAGRLVSHGDAVPDSAPTSGEGTQAAPKTFTESLASRLREGAADIVRSAQVVLREGGFGMIRLRLEPESLGGVKIELKLAEKQISGKIVVESDIAGEAFKSSLDALKDAFAECGFETTSLEVEVRNGMASGTGPDGRDHGEAGMDDGPYWSRSLRELDAAVPSLSQGGRDGLLNVIV